jgi:Zn-dependent protease
VAGIRIRVHLSFLLLVALFVLVAPDPGLVGAAASVGWLLAVFACVLVHELAHCVVARARGGEVEEILLFPLGGVSKLHHLPESPRDEYAIAIAGPLTSIGLGLGAALLCVATGRSLLSVDFVTGAWLVRLAWLNLILGVFNLLPAFPLDGGRVLRSRLERTHDLESATHIAAHMGRVLAVVLMVVGVFFDIWLTLIGIFVYFGATAEEAGTIVHARLRGHRVREAMQVVANAPAPPEVSVDADALLDDDLLELVEQAPGHCVTVQERGATVGILRLEDVVHLASRSGSGGST